MKKLILLFVLILFTTNVKSVSAESLYVISSDGTLQRNILGESSTITDAVKAVSQRVANAAISGVEEVVFQQIEDKTNVKLRLPTKDQDQVVAASLKNLMEIESTEPSEKVVVTRNDEGFGIAERGITATTSMTVGVKPETHEISIETSNGKQVLSVLPSEAVSILVRANVLTTLESDGKVLLEEQEDGQLVYVVNGERAMNLFNIATVLAPVTSKVSVSTGHVENIDQPKWVTILGFLLG